MTQFEFCSNLAEGEELNCSFPEWTRWHSLGYKSSSGEHDELEWLAKEKDIISSPRARAIDRCRKEMIELVNDMPEDAFELSLKDLVELPRTARESPRRYNSRNQDEGKVKKAQWKYCRNQSAEGAGFLLKMFFPIPSSSYGKKKKNGSKTCSRSSSSGSLESGSDSTRPLMKHGRKAGVDKSSEGKLAVKQHGALRRNCSRNSLMLKGSAAIFLRSICNNFKY